MIKSGTGALPVITTALRAEAGDRWLPGQPGPHPRLCLQETKAFHLNKPDVISNAYFHCLKMHPHRNITGMFLTFREHTVSTCFMNARNSAIKGAMARKFLARFTTVWAMLFWPLDEALWEAWQLTHGSSLQVPLTAIAHTTLHWPRLGIWLSHLSRHSTQIFLNTDEEQGC